MQMVHWCLLHGKQLITSRLVCLGSLGAPRFFAFLLLAWVGNKFPKIGGYSKCCLNDA